MRVWFLVMLAACERDPPEPRGPGVSLPAPTPIDTQPIDAGQPMITWRLQRWDGKVVADTNRGHFILDLETGARSPLRLPGCATIEWLSDPGTVALCRDGAKRRVVRRGATDTVIDVPAVPLHPDLADDDHARVAADDASIVVATPEHLLWYRDGAWTTYRDVMSREVGNVWSRVPRMVVQGDRLVGGWHGGDHSGAVGTFDRASGQWVSADPTRLGGLQVEEVLATPDGTIWVVSGHSHLGYAGAAIGPMRGRWFHAVAGDGVRGLSRGRDWGRGDAAFVAAAVDTDGALVVLAAPVGVFRFDGARWTDLAPGWTEMAYPRSLVLDGRTIAVGNQEGVRLIDRDSGSTRWMALD